MNLFKLITSWYAFKEENKLSGNHTDLFFFCVDLNNRLAWKEVFGLNTCTSAEMLNMSPNTFRKVFGDLVKLKIIDLRQKSPNQFTANKISLKMAYQNLLQLSDTNYHSYVTAQSHQLRTTCAIDIQEYKNTLIQLEEKENKEKEFEKQILGLGIKIESMESDLVAKNKEIEDLRLLLEKEKKRKTPKTAAFSVDDVERVYKSEGFDSDTHKWASITHEFMSWKVQTGKGAVKTAVGLKTLCCKIARISNRDIDIATAIFEDSISNGWSGIFEPKGDKKLIRTDPPQKANPADYQRINGW